MDSVIGCTTGPVAPFSSRVAKKAGSVSPPELESLRSPRDFRRVLNEGKRYRSGGLVVVASSEHPGPARYGLVVSKSSGNAVTRNRIKRRLRHCIRSLQLNPGHDYVIIASQQVADVPFTRLQGWLERAMKELADV